MVISGHSWQAMTPYITQILVQNLVTMMYAVWLYWTVLDQNTLAHIVAGCHATGLVLITNWRGRPVNLYFQGDSNKRLRYIEVFIIWISFLFESLVFPVNSAFIIWALNLIKWHTCPHSSPLRPHIIYALHVGTIITFTFRNLQNVDGDTCQWACIQIWRGEAQNIGTVKMRWWCNGNVECDIPAVNPGAISDAHTHMTLTATMAGQLVIPAHNTTANYKDTFNIHLALTTEGVCT